MGYDKDMQGAAFKNYNKKTANHPDMVGKALINNREVWVSVWIKQIQNGNRRGEKMVSFAFNPITQPRPTPRRNGGYENPPNQYSDGQNQYHDTPPPQYQGWTPDDDPFR